MKTLLVVLAIFTIYLPIRTVENLPPIITDIESHLPKGHPYQDSDYITYVHEGTHGINSRLRGQYNKPAFYILNNRAVIMDEPMITLVYSTVAAQVPKSLRGDVYNLYLRQMRRWWNNQPTYVFDEWVAYTNGAQARQELGITSRKETVRYMLEFVVYSACVPMAANSDDPVMLEFYRWQVSRCMKIYQQSGLESPYLNKLRTAADAENLRIFIRDYCGERWTKKVLGF